jgi:hypothetical protein
VLQTLVTYRLIDPGSEWRLHREWFKHSAMADLLDEDFSLAQKDNLYRCLDRLLKHRDALFQHLGRGGKICSERSSKCCFTIRPARILRATHLFPKAINAAMDTVATSAPTVCRWSLRWWSRPKAFPWPMR